MKITRRDGSEVEVANDFDLNINPRGMRSEGQPLMKLAETQHLLLCEDCGKFFDPADLTQVLYHERHEPVPVLIGTDGKPIRGTREDDDIPF